MSKFRSNRSKDSSRPLAVSFVALFGWVCFVKEFKMRHLLILLAVSILLIACSNPAGISKEYEIKYIIDGSGLILSAFCFNPETDTAEEWDYYTQYDVLIAEEGELLWLEVEGIGGLKAQIWVDDIMVAETSGGLEGEPFYVEWMLE